MRKPGIGLAIVLIVIAGLLVGHPAGQVGAQTSSPTDEVVLGARLYDDWGEVKSVTPPPGSRYYPSILLCPPHLSPIFGYN